MMSAPRPSPGDFRAWTVIPRRNASTLYSRMKRLKIQRAR
jgi:hypothetical protein